MDGPWADNIIRLVYLVHPRNRAGLINALLAEGKETIGIGMQSTWSMLHRIVEFGHRLYPGGGGKMPRGRLKDGSHFSE